MASRSKSSLLLIIFASLAILTEVFIISTICMGPIRLPYGASEFEPPKSPVCIGHLDIPPGQSKYKNTGLPFLIYEGQESNEWCDVMSSRNVLASCLDAFLFLFLLFFNIYFGLIIIRKIYKSKVRSESSAINLLLVFGFSVTIFIAVIILTTIYGSYSYFE